MPQDNKQIVFLYILACLILIYSAITQPHPPFRSICKCHCGTIGECNSALHVCVCGGGEETYYKQLQNLWVGIETLLRLESKFVKKQTGARDLSACLNIRIQKMQESSVNATSTCHTDDMADLRAVPRFCYTVCEACRPKIASKTKNRIHKKG